MITITSKDIEYLNITEVIITKDQIKDTDKFDVEIHLRGFDFPDYSGDEKTVIIKRQELFDKIIETVQNHLENYPINFP